MTKKIDLDFNHIPKHIAFIIDGNGRWAKKRNMPRSYGHKVGLDMLEKAVKSARKLGVKIVSIFVFSTENWKRPKEEVDYLFGLFEKSVQKILKKNNFDNGVCYRHMGDLSKLSENMQNLTKQIIEKSKHNQDFIVNVGLNYGGRDELVRTYNKMANKGLKDITIKDIEENLDTNGLPDPEFVIRTSGEQRISNFMLFQMAYSELYFTPTYWPDFDEKELIKALQDFQTRKRKFGGLTEDKKWKKEY